MEHLEDWHKFDFHLIHDVYRNRLEYLAELVPKEADALLRDPSWTKATFIRDPKERLLSGYLDHGRSYDSMLRHCCVGSPYGLREPEAYNDLLCNVSKKRIRYVISAVVQDVIPHCENPHWLLQTTVIPSNLQLYLNFVGRIEHLETDTRRMLERVGAWAEHGANRLAQ